jgi:hypothetical protein
MRTSFTDYDSAIFTATEAVKQLFKGKNLRVITSVSLLILHSE